MIRRPPRSTRTDTRFPYTTLFRSGAHSFFKAFAPTATPDYSHLTEGLGRDWYMQRVVFKPYACGTMIHPYIDCTIRLAQQGIRSDDLVSVVCETGEGLVHRLWEPLAAKQSGRASCRERVWQYG